MGMARDGNRPAGTRPEGSGPPGTRPEMGAYQAVDGLAAEVAGGVLRLTLDRPAQRNALTDVSLTALIRGLERAATDEDLRAVLITGAGTDFCSGFDIVARNAARDGEARPRTGSIQRRLAVQAGRLIPLLLELQRRSSGRARAGARRGRRGVRGGLPGDRRAGSGGGQGVVPATLTVTREAGA